MHAGTVLKQQRNNCRLKTIATTVRSQAYSCQGDSLALLALLRLLEALHVEIRESLFLESLPNDRQTLYALLQNIEEEGGWPFIQRMKLRSLLANLAENPPTELEPDKRESDKPQFSLKQGEIR